MSAYPGREIERESENAANDPSSCHGSCRGRRVPAALVAAVEEDSPAYDAGFEPGCYVTHVDGLPVRDIIDWRWLSSDDEMTVGYIDLDGEAGEVELERYPGEDWGFSFEGVVFDGVKQCRNVCTFCFMRQLPAGMRSSLTLRDDDFRLSFLSGTFVTLTNLAPEDEARIIEQRISPLRVSLQATDADARLALMGRHAAHGLAALDRLLAAGIEVHAQIVLVPEANDGETLRRTLEWAYARPGILNVGIVPLGYTKPQDMFDRSFNEPHEAQAVLGLIAPFQEQALAERDTPWVYAADEFYRNAYGIELLENLPSSSHYGDFSMFEDGIGIIRSFVDDWRETQAAGIMEECAHALREAGAVARFVVGEAMMPFLQQLIDESPLHGMLQPLVVKNDFFGGNVDVTGLLCGCDIAAAVKGALSILPPSEGEETAALALEAQAADGGGRSARSSAATETVQWTVSPSEDCVSTECLPPFAADGVNELFLLPSVILNDDALTLDGMTLEDIETAAGAPIAVVFCNPSEFLPQIAALAAERR